MLKYIAITIYEGTCTVVYAGLSFYFLTSLGLLKPPSESTKGGVLGPTFQCLIAEQFRRLRKWDRFWHENEAKASSHTTNTAFTACQLEGFRKTSLAKVICSNNDNITAIPKEILSLAKGFVSCSELPDVNPEFFFCFLLFSFSFF